MLARNNITSFQLYHSITCRGLGFDLHSSLGIIFAAELLHLNVFSVLFAVASICEGFAGWLQETEYISSFETSKSIYYALSYKLQKTQTW